MNTNIVRKFNQCLHESNHTKALKLAAEDIINTHNKSVFYGLIQLPLLDFCNVIQEDNTIIISANPKSGLININDLFNIKTVWGADSVDIYTCSDNGIIEFSFNLKSL